MQIRELFESQYHSVAASLIQSETLKLQNVLNEFNELANIKGWQFAENNAKQMLLESYSDEWLMIPIINSSNKLQKAYKNLQLVRNKLSEKIKSGV